MERSTGILALVAGMLVLALLYTMTVQPTMSTGQTDPTEDLFKPTVDVTAAYLADTPFPAETATPIDPSIGAYVGWTATDLANAVVTNLERDGSAVQPTSVLLTTDVASTSAQTVTDGAVIARGSDPDLAILLSGSFRAMLPYDAAGAAPTTYALVVVDRISGSIYAIVRSNDLSYLQGLLPPP